MTIAELGESPQLSVCLMDGLRLVVSGQDSEAVYGEVAGFLAGFAATHGVDEVLETLEQTRLATPDYALLVGAAEFFLDRQEPLRALPFAEAAYSARSQDLYNSRLLNRARRAAFGGDQGEAKIKGFCRQPFEHFETGMGGDVFLCCSGWLPQSIGNLNESTWAEIWNSKTAQAIRASIHDGSYRYCNPLICPTIVAGALEDPASITEPAMRRVVDEKAVILDDGPKIINLSHDSSCNLACPTCRTGKYVAKGAQREKLMELADTVVLPLVNETPCTVSMTGSGDPFASQHFRYVIKHIEKRDYPNINLQTNGLLFDALAWEDLRLEGKVKNVQVSIDASTEPVYRVVRKFGDFHRLMRNLKFISGLRRDERIGNLRLDFVVQARNFADMPGAVEIGRELGADHVSFNSVTNWGTFTPEEYAQQAISSPEHPQFAEFIEILRHPALRWDRIWWGSLSDVVAFARDR